MAKNQLIENQLFIDSVIAVIAKTGKTFSYACIVSIGSPFMKLLKSPISLEMYHIV